MDQVVGQGTEVAEYKKDNKSQTSVIVFGNRALSNNSLEVYQRAVREYHDYLKETVQSEDSESVKEWLEIVREKYSSNTFNLNPN